MAQLLPFSLSVITPPGEGLRSNIQFHILCLIGNSMMASAYILSTDEPPCFPQEAGAHNSPMLLPTVVVCTGIGLFVHLHLNSKLDGKGKVA